MGILKSIPLGGQGRIPAAGQETGAPPVAQEISVGVLTWWNSNSTIADASWSSTYMVRMASANGNSQ
jgi:hypothetical protein